MQVGETTPVPGPPIADSGPRSRFSWLRGWRTPVHRDGLALVLSSALSSGIGLIYWVVVARLFPPDVVGVNQVALSTMMMLGGVAHLNLTYALLRFVPVAGAATRRLVIAGYLVTVVVASLVGGVFALGARIWAPQLLAAVGQLGLLAFFMLATPVWAIFTVQDYVLTGIRKARLVPLENLVFAVLKVGLLAVAAWFTVQGGIAVSWVAATAIVVLGVTVWLLARALPAHGRTNADKAVPITLGSIATYLRADYAGAVFWQAAIMGLPVLVLARLGAEAAATYGIVWQIGMALYLVASGMGQSMVAHSAADPGGLEAARKAMITKALTLIVPVVAVLVLASPLVLSIFGSHYVESGTGALVLIALSAVPNVITAATVSSARVRQRMGVLFGVPATISMIVIVLSWVLMPYLGITGVALAWLLGQSVMSAVILTVTAPWLPPLLATRVDALRSAALLRRVGPDAVLTAGVEHPDRWVVRERLSGGSESVVVSVRPEDGPGALLKACDTVRSTTGLRRQTEVLSALHGDARIAHWTVLIPTILGAGDVGGSYCVMESRMPGEAGTLALHDPARRRLLTASAISTISELHRCTSTTVVAGDDELRRWVHDPMAVVIDAVPRNLRSQARRLADGLDRRMRGRRLPVGWMHGDYGPVNVLTRPDGRVCAVVDWCEADERGFPVLDVMIFLQLSHVIADGEELGPMVLRWLQEPLPPGAHLLARAQRTLGGEPLDPATMALLGWLQHVSTTIAKSREYAANPVWNRRNLRAVLRGAATTYAVDGRGRVPNQQATRSGAAAEATG
ncbi:phosphotransferase [Pseudonocardia hispaniensis]|uniref:Phosphotransferase n=1 Tax=Pseudonocardia hispaniensis TaxID=904933 RepID=A0ABW1J1Z7_9PSEU